LVLLQEFVTMHRHLNVKFYVACLFNIYFCIYSLLNNVAMSRNTLICEN